MILAFDATGAHAAAMIWDDGRARAAVEEPMTRGQADRLFPLIEAALAKAGASYGDMRAIAVSTGPGNFTGARAGVAAARGLALSLGVPAVGVDRFEAAAPEGYNGWVRIEARGGAAHVARFQAGREAFAATLQAAEAETALGGAPALAADRVDLSALARRATVKLAKDGIRRPAPRYLRPPNATPAAPPPPHLP